MNDLVKQDLTLDSREVAEMVGKRHDNLIRDIERYIDHISTTSNLRTFDFFIISTYADAKGEERPNYQVTKKGCEFIAHKLTGQKGTIFTATYINKFHEMESELTTPKKLSPMQQLKLQYAVLDEHDERLSYLENNMTVDYGQQNTLRNKAKSKVVSLLGGIRSHAYKNNSIRSKAFSYVWRDFQDYFNVASYRDTARVDYQKALDYLDGWQVQGRLLREIEDCNNQIDMEEII